jgi:hypothetical protein
MQLETWPLAFVRNARNPRKNDHLVHRMVASDREFPVKVRCSREARRS